MIKMLTKENILDQLLHHFPNLQEKYEKELAGWEGEFTGFHNLFGMVFNPYIKEKLTAYDHEALIKIFNFLEMMAESDDEDIINVLVVTVLEAIYFSDDAIVQKYCKSKTKKLGDELEEFWQKVGERVRLQRAEEDKLN
jgi:hypothetical protein